MQYEEDIHVSLSTESTRSSFIQYIAQAQWYRCVTLKYQSKIDWTEARNILHCNPDFHGKPHFNCVVIHEPLGSPVLILKVSFPAGFHLER